MKGVALCLLLALGVEAGPERREIGLNRDTREDNRTPRYITCVAPAQCVPTWQCEDYTVKCREICGRGGRPAARGDCKKGGQCAADSVCCSPQITAGDDPFMVGLQGQAFLFDGRDDTWYSLIHDPEKLNLNMHIYSPNPKDGKTTYIDGIGVTAKSEDGEEHKILIKVKDPSDFKPKCVGKNGEAKKLCVANGALTIVIDGKEITKPGHYEPSPDITLAAFNAPEQCKLIPDSHSHWDEIEAARLESVAKLHARHLVIYDPSNDILSLFESQHVSNPEFCSKWIKERQDNDDLYKVSGGLSTMFISFETFAIRVEYVMNENITGRWDKHQRFDITLLGFKPTEDDEGNALTSGVLGETADLKMDKVLNSPILSGRGVLSGKDEDYEVSGPFGDTFIAQDFARVRRHL